jgi:PPOX class probable F420-dependent enzyme
VGRWLMGAGAIVRLAYGVGALLAPGAMCARRLAPDVRGHPAGRMDFRGFGGLHANIAALTLHGAVRDRNTRLLLGLNLGCELSDVTATLLEWRARGRADRVLGGSLLLACAGLVTWTVALRTLGPSRRGTLSERFGQAANRLYPRLTRRADADVARGAPAGGVHVLAGHKYCTVVSYRRSGEPVATPVWFGVADGRVYFRSLDGAAKLKRIARNPDVLVAPCTPRGTPTAPAFAGRARLLPAAEAAEAECRIQDNYGPGRRAYEWAIRDAAARYVEIVPDAA